MFLYCQYLDFGTSKPLDKKPTSVPIKRDEKRVGAPDEVKGKEIEILWPTDREIQEGEYTKPQWERKQVNVRNIHCLYSSCMTCSSIYGMDMISMINFVMKLR